MASPVNVITRLGSLIRFPVEHGWKTTPFALVIFPYQTSLVRGGVP